MSIFIAVLVRVVATGAGLAAYYALLPTLFPDDGGGANIGAGLIAFGALMLIGFAGSLVDGRIRGVATALIIWAIVAAIISVGWLVALSSSEADSSMSVRDLIINDLATLPFTAGLIFGPALVGAFIGHALRPARDH